MFFSFHRWRPTRGKWQARASHLPQTHTCTHKHAHLFTNAYPFVCVKARWAVQPRTQSALLRWGTLCIYPAGHPYFPLRGPTELHFHSISMRFFRMSFFFYPWGDQKQTKCSVACCVSVAGPHKGQWQYCNPIPHVSHISLFCVSDFQCDQWQL